jgi:hypothetical protein
MTGHRPRRPGPAEGAGQGPAILVAAVGTLAEADQAIACGADMIDAGGLTGQDLAALRARHPGARLWAGAPAAADADQAGPVAAVVATASVLAWLGTAAIRTRHVLQVRRAIDMTGTIAGTRLPALTIRGLA